LLDVSEKAVLAANYIAARVKHRYHLPFPSPYAHEFILVPPREEVPREKAGVFDCSRDHKRHPRETKGMEYNVTQMSDRVCGPDSNCCP